MKLMTALLMLFCTSARAEQGLEGRIYLFNPEMRFEESSEQNLESRQAQNFAAAVSFDLWSLVLETSQYKELTGSGAVSIERSHREYNLWLQREMMNFSLTNNGSISLYAGIGAGLFEEQVKTETLGESALDKGTLHGLFAASLGAEYLWLYRESTNPWGLVVGLEGRGFYSDEFQPHFQPGAMMRVGFHIELGK